VRFLQQSEDLLRLPKVLRLDLRAVKEVAGEQEDIRFPVDRGPSHMFECHREVAIRQPAVESTAAEVDVCGVE
jgi:hypothetical protein